MRILLLTLCGCLALGTAVAQNPTEPPVPTSVPDTAAAQELSEPRSPGGAELRLAQTVCDFGEVLRKGGDLVYDVAFTNAGDAPLVFTRIITSCSCLKASFPRRPVAPGGEGVIRITYEPLKSQPGAFNKVLQVCSNARSGRDVITVQGTSIDEERPARKIRIGKMKVKIK